ncbi:MAG: hypothetical protein IJ654_05330 [Bacteroidales bacterium]|nr:hypothetical protein [Bacteroidales bacterium]
MVYLANTTEAQPLFVPRSRAEVVGDLMLTLRSTVGLAIVVDTDAIDLNTSALYYRIAVALPGGLAEGEYEYTLSDAAGVLSTGIAYVGELDQPTETDNAIIYEQIEL